MKNPEELNVPAAKRRAGIKALLRPLNGGDGFSIFFLVYNQYAETINVEARRVICGGGQFDCLKRQCV